MNNLFSKPKSLYCTRFKWRIHAFQCRRAKGSRSRQYGIGGPKEQDKFWAEKTLPPMYVVHPYPFWIAGGLACVIGLYFWSNQRKEVIPVTGRVRSSLLSKRQEERLCTWISSMLKVTIPSDKILEQNSKETRWIEEIGDKVCLANGLPKHKYIVINSGEVNAFVFAGEVFVYKGILPVMKNQSGAAMILSHEIAHSIAGHGMDNLKNIIIIYGLLGSIALLSGLTTTNSYVMKFVQFLCEGAYHLPRSRADEIEADKIGLHFMAKACFDVKEAHTVFVRLKEVQTEENGWLADQFDFMSTHPSLDLRITNLSQWVKEPGVSSLSLSCKVKSPSLRQTVWIFK